MVIPVLLGLLGLLLFGLCSVFVFLFWVRYVVLKVGGVSFGISKLGVVLYLFSLFFVPKIL